MSLLSAFRVVQPVCRFCPKHDYRWITGSGFSAVKWVYPINMDCSGRF